MGIATNQPIPFPQSASMTNGIRDIKPPVEIPSGWEWVWWGLGALAVATLLYLAWRQARKRQSDQPVPPPIPAHLRARY